MADRYHELHELTLRFLDAFNRNDLDAVMTFFSDDAQYEELNGRSSRGRAAIRTAFEPQFAGKFGRMQFDEDDTFIDADRGKVMSSWDLRIAKDAGEVLLQGLDLLHFADRLIVRKQTYCKAQSALYLAAGAA